MQIAINIPDEIAALAEASGLTPERFVEQRLSTETGSMPDRRLAPKLTHEEFDAVLDQLAQYSHKIPNLPLEAFSRESLYEDHD